NSVGLKLPGCTFIYVVADSVGYFNFWLSFHIFRNISNWKGHNMMGCLEAPNQGGNNHNIF
ncbi:hypothetical protein ACQP3F_32540, partial [Escherichia coli]